MDRYRYFIFNHRSMVVLGILQIACAGISIVSGFMDGAFRRESTLGRTRAPLWAGLIMTIPGVLALFSSQKKNPVLVNALIAASIFSCFTTVIVIVYSSLTLGYGEDDDDIFSAPAHVIHARFILGKLVQGANIAMLIASVSSLCIALSIAYMSCRSLPHCMCYDDITGMDWLHPEHEQPQTVELVCTFRGGDERIFNSASQFTDCSVETEEEFSRPPPYVRFS